MENRSLLWLLLLLSVQRGAWAHFTFTPNSTNHLQLTQAAILQTTADACRALAREMGTDFMLPPGPLSVSSLVKACSASESSIRFWVAITDIGRGGALVEVTEFSTEVFQLGRELIINGIAAVKASVKQHNFEAARAELGEVLHTLQDFYTHSCFIELGNNLPFYEFIRPDQPLGNLFDQCDAGLDSHIGMLHPQANAMAIGASIDLLQDIRAAAGDMDFLRLMRLSQSASALCFVIDTTGSMGDDIEIVRQTTSFIIDSKMGTPDEPSEYILVPFNDPDFGPLFETTDPEEFKQQINQLRARGGGDFPEMSLSALQLALTGAPYYSEIFVFTDASAKDIGLKSTILALIERSKSTVNFLLTNALGLRGRMGIAGQLDHQGFTTVGPPPVGYQQVTGGQTMPPMDYQPFDYAHIPTVGQQPPPMHYPGMAMHGDVWPPFGYSPPPLPSAATPDGQQLGGLPPASRSLSNPVNLDYQDLAQASGGLAIEVSKATLPQATSIIVDASSSALVTLLQAVKDPGVESRFDFFVDSSLTNLTIYITGQNLVFTVTSATGVSQGHMEPTGALGTINRVGNFHRVHITTPLQKGLWAVDILSMQPYTVKVVGQSPIGFLFHFVEEFEGPLPGFEFLQSRPLANSPVTLLLYTTEPESVQLSEVMLVKMSGERVSATRLEEKVRGVYLATVPMVPEGSFTVQVRGYNNRDMISSLEIFQRQSPTQFKASLVQINAESTATLNPGVPLTIPFTVESSISGTFAIRARNDRAFSMLFNRTLTIGAVPGFGQGAVVLTSPPNTLSGTDVTLTIEAEAPGALDSNYAVLRLMVLEEVTDVHPPMFHMINISAPCTGNCSLSTWQLWVALTDGNGTGIERLAVRQGSGSLNTRVVTGSDGVAVTLATYTASCCSEEVELVAVDAVGNVGTFFRSIKPPPRIPCFLRKIVAQLKQGL